MRKFLVFICLLIAFSGRPLSGTVAASSSVTVTATPATASYGSLFTLVAVVQDQRGNPITNGAVTFYNGATVLGTAQVVSSASGGCIAGTATLKTTLVSLGSNSITATYTGASGAISTSAPVEVTITGQYPSTTSLAASGSAGDYALIATLLGSGPIAATGSVVFSDTTTGLEIGTAPINPSTPAQTFAAAPSATGVTAPNVVALADLNGDGIPDLVTGSTAGLFVQLGNGDGIFKVPIEVSATSISFQDYFNTFTGARVVFGDFNGDGNLDIAFIACATGNCAVRVALGNGDGTFQPERDYDVAGAIGGIATGDFNGDGIPDIVAANFANGTVDLLLGNGDGTFQAPQTTSVPEPSSIAAADLNADGRLDLIVSNWSAGTISVLLGNGDGTFQPAQPYATGGNPSNITLADLRGIGKLDILLLDGNNAVSVLLGNGDGTFQPATAVYAPASPASLQSLGVADVNGDGLPDLVLSDGVGNTVDVLPGNGDGTFQSPAFYPVGTAPTGLALADLNHDGRPDIVVANQAGNSITILLNQVIESATLTNVAVPGTGKHSVSATYSGDANFAASASSPLLLAANLVTPSMALAALPAASVAWGQPLSLSITLFAPSSALPAPSGTASYSIDKGATVKATLSGGAVILSISQLSVGTHCISVTYSGDAYFGALPAQTLVVTVTQASPSISWGTPAAITYGTALSGTQLKASSKVAGTFVYSPPAGTMLTAGSQTLSVTFTPASTIDYTPATASVPLTVNQATPAISWPAPKAIPYGTELSAAQLDASTPVAGTFTYTPAAGTILTVGSQTLSVTFTPADTIDYNPVTANVKLTVSVVRPAITWATPAPIAYGTALSTTQLDATSPVPGIFAYSPVAGTVLAAGTRTLSVTFTPTDTADYTTATSTVTQLVGPNLLTQPSSIAVVSGHAANFSVSASGAPTLTYQWQYLSGVTWRCFGAGTGLTSATLTTFPTTSAFNGLQLRVVVTDGNGVSAVSIPATLSITPAILTQPVAQAVPDGNPAVFTVVADGVPALSYDWQYLNGSTWEDFGAGTGRNTATLTTFPTTAAYNYLELRVAVTDANGLTVTSNAVKLSVAPAIAIAPLSQTVPDSSSAIFTVAAQGVGTLCYVWQYWTGSTWGLFTSAKGYYSATLTTFPITAGLNGLQLRVQVTGGNGLSVVSDPVTLTVGPGIATQPSHQTEPVGWSATFSVVASGVPSLTYQWQYLDGTTWEPFGAGTGYNTATLTTFNTTLAYNGLQLRVVVTDGNGLTITSKAVTLTVIL